MNSAEETWGSVYYREKYEKPELEQLRVEIERLRAALDVVKNDTRFVHLHERTIRVVRAATGEL